MTDLSGKYQLISHGTFDLSGNFSPTSEKFSGELIYSIDGYISVLILFSDKELLAYTGKYEVKSVDVVIHHISLCNQTKRNGSSESRTFRVLDDGLSLGIKLREGRFEAIWKKS